jgi:glycine/D-amino acid oxidase-like deaminating enzyme
MRVCVIGAGIAGTFLAWRLANRPGVFVDLVTGPSGDDATAVSGGGVRAFETHPEQRRLAIESLAELLESPALLEQAAYTETGSTYLLAGSRGVEAAVSEVEHVHPDSVELVGGATLRRLGWHGLPEGTVGVLERRAGFIRPDQLRAAVIEDLASGPRASVVPGPVIRLVPHPDGSVSCRTPGSSNRYDVVAVAAGPWTPGLLSGNDLPAEPYRTKAIRSTRSTELCRRCSWTRPATCTDARPPTGACCSASTRTAGRCHQATASRSRTWPNGPSGLPASGCLTSGCWKPPGRSTAPTVMPIRRS